jgi:hypothetical protein
MNKYPINSDNILNVGYDEVKQILGIEFKINVIHLYFEVPLDEFVDFMKVDDVEEFYVNFIHCKYHYEVFILF